MVKIDYILATLILTISYFGNSQNFEKVKLPKPVGEKYAFSQVEPSIIIDPNNTDNIAAGSILSDYYYSQDGGKTWSSKLLKSTFGVHGDPVLIFDSKGRVYYFHLASYNKSSHLDRIVCQSSDSVDGIFTDGSFPKPNGTKVQDKHWVVADSKTDDLYMTWTQFDTYDSHVVGDSSMIMFSKSTDQGVSWSEPRQISFFLGDCLDDDNTVEGAVPALGPNGELYVSWTGPKGLVFQKSLDGGSTWMNKEKLLLPHPGGWNLKIPGIYRANGLPILKCDLSDGPFKGRLYLNWCDQENGKNDTDSWLLTSDDGGETWSDKIRVNQDTTNSHQFLTWMSIDQSSGFLYIIYYDRRNYSNNFTDVYMSVSKNGGKTFTDFKLSDTPFLPDNKVFFGDYLNIDAVDGEIRPIWPRMDDQKISLWVALINQTQLDLITQ